MFVNTKIQSYCFTDSYTFQKKFLNVKKNCMRRKHVQISFRLHTTAFNEKNTIFYSLRSYEFLLCVKIKYISSSYIPFLLLCSQLTTENNVTRRVFKMRAALENEYNLLSKKIIMWNCYNSFLGNVSVINIMRRQIILVFKLKFSTEY